MMRLDLICTLLSDNEQSPPIPLQVRSINSERFMAVGTAPHTGTDYRRFSMEFAGAVAFGDVDDLPYLIEAGQEVTLNVTMTNNPVTFPPDLA